MRRKPSFEGQRREGDRPHRARGSAASLVPSEAHVHLGDTPRVLIIDDDSVARDVFESILQLEGFSIVAAATGERGIALARQSAFDVILVDLRLKDMSGLDVIAALREYCSAPLVLVSGFLSIYTAVHAMKQGAFDVLEKPVDVESLRTVLRQARQRSHPWLVRPLTQELSYERVIAAPRSVVERWVGYVLKVCDTTEAERGGDFKTLEDWARRVAVSYSTLCEACRLLGIRPLDGRDFARVLSALRLAIVHACVPEVLLNVSNRRILRSLSARASIDLEVKVEPASLFTFLETQRFIPSDAEAVRLIHAFTYDWLVQRQRVLGAQ